MRYAILLVAATLLLPDPCEAARRSARSSKSRARSGKAAVAAKKRVPRAARSRPQLQARLRQPSRSAGVAMSAQAPTSGGTAIPAAAPTASHSGPCSHFMAKKTKNNFLDCARVIFTHKPVHALLPAVIVPGSSFAIAGAYETERNTEMWQNAFKLTSAVTFRKYAAIEARGRLTHEALIRPDIVRDRFRIEPYARFRNLPSLDYYGLGFSTRKDDRTEFHRRDMAIGMQVYNPLTNWLAVGGNIESLWLRINNGSNGDGKNILARFNDASAPGIAGQAPHFLRYEAFVSPHYPERLPYMIDYKVGYTYNQDNAGGRFTHARFEVDLKHDFKFPLPRTNHLLVRTHLATTSTAPGKQVPFYLMDTIGGWDLQNDPMLRSFPDYRFRDRNHMLYSVEYIYDFWKGFGLGAFYDTGTVASRAGDLSFGNMRHSYGFGMALLRGDRPYFRGYLAFGGGEGVHPFWGLPKLF